MKKEVFPVLTSVIILLTGLGVAKLFDLLKPSQVWATIGIACVLACAYMATAAAYHNDRHNSELTQIIGSLRGALAQHYPPWLFTSLTLLPKEAETIHKEVWVVSPNLSNDTFQPEAEIPTVVRKNAASGVTYTYFIPRTPSIVPAIHALRQLFSKTPQRLEIIELSPDEWNSNFMAHILVLNPLAKKDSPPSVYFELPLDEQGYGRSHWVEVTRDTATHIVGNLHTLKEKHHAAKRA